MSIIFSGVGALFAAVGSGVLLARCFRGPRGDLIAWSLALLGLLVSLGSQTFGYLTGFDGATFRATELGGQVIAPLALTLGLCEVAAKSMGARFCARLYIPSLALVGTVVLLLDQLAPAAFTKAWPDPAVYYQTPPDYVLMFAIGPVTAIVSLIAVATVVRRSGEPGWNPVLRPELMAGAAAIMLAYPSLAQLVRYQAHIHLPIRSGFTLLCAAAAALTWLAGARIGELPLDMLHGSGRGRGGRFHSADRSGDSEPSGPVPAWAAGLQRSGPDERNASRNFGRDGGEGSWPDERARVGDSWRPGEPVDGARHAEPVGTARSGEPVGRGGRGDQRYESAELPPADFATGDFVAGDFATEDAGHDAAGGWQPGRQEPDGEQEFGGGWRSDGQRELDSRAGEEAGRAQLFGQIAIYTLLEDTVNEFDQLTERVVEQVRSHEPDTLVYIVHAVPSAPLQRILYEVYRDRRAYERHGQQPYARQFEADRRPYVLATNVIELGLQQAKVSPFPSVAELLGEPGYDTSGFERPDYLRDYGRPSSREYR
jgi:quinol monooxygenase YgiN